MVTRGSNKTAASAADQAPSPSPSSGQGAAVAAVTPDASAQAERVRDGYSFSQLDLAQIEALKRRAAELGFLGSAAKKNALLRAGIAALATLSDEQLRAVLGAEMDAKATPTEGSGTRRERRQPR